MITNVHAAGLQDPRPFELLLDEQHRLSHLDVDLLVLGRLARRRVSLLGRLRYRKGRRAPTPFCPKNSLSPAC